VNFQTVLNEVYAIARADKNRGKIATYIPELAKVSIDNFAVHLLTKDQQEFSAGQVDDKFSIQSISKVLSLSQAMGLAGDEILQRVDVEPSGNPFNFLSLLQLENGIPRNPLINTGALVIADILVSNLSNPKEDFLRYIRNLANDEDIDFDFRVAQSEKETGFTNRAAANLLKSFGNIKNDVDVVLDFYYHQCSIAMNAKQLAATFFMFANRGNCIRNNSFLNISQVKRVNALMLTCGFYDEAGEFAYEVGLPGKSGVGGGIVAILPNQYCIVTWSPGLNKKGNSQLGMKALEAFTTKTGLSIF
jgi:glutaminase